MPFIDNELYTDTRFSNSRKPAKATLASGELRERTECVASADAALSRVGHQRVAPSRPSARRSRQLRVVDVPPEDPPGKPRRHVTGNNAVRLPPPTTRPGREPGAWSAAGHACADQWVASAPVPATGRFRCPIQYARTHPIRTYLSRELVATQIEVWLEVYVRRMCAALCRRGAPASVATIDA